MAVQVLPVSAPRRRRGGPRHLPLSARPMPHRVLHLWHLRFFFGVSNRALSIPFLVHELSAASRALAYPSMAEFYPQCVPVDHRDVRLIALPMFCFSDRLHSQIRLGDVEDRFPRIEALVEEDIEVLRDAQLPKHLLQFRRHAECGLPSRHRSSGTRSKPRGAGTVCPRNESRSNKSLGPDVRRADTALGREVWDRESCLTALGLDDPDSTASQWVLPGRVQGGRVSFCSYALLCEAAKHAVRSSQE